MQNLQTSSYGLVHHSMGELFFFIPVRSVNLLWFPWASSSSSSGEKHLYGSSSQSTSCPCYILHPREYKFESFIKHTVVVEIHKTKTGSVFIYISVYKTISLQSKLAHLALCCLILDVLVVQLSESGCERQPSEEDIKAAIWEVCGNAGSLQLLVDLLTAK